VTVRSLTGWGAGRFFLKKLLVGLNGKLVEYKMRTFWVKVDILALKSVPFRPRTVQVPNLALT
jgi:hypothetical protein